MSDKLITLGPKFFERPMIDQVIYLRKGWSSSNEALEQMQIERNDLLCKVNEMQALLEAGQRSLEIQKAINHNSITDSNERMQRDGAEIQRLKALVPK